MTTPKEIKTLKENEIFIFGSNLNGNHAGGAAKYAKDNFGAVDGVVEGLTGQSYAFPTLDKDMQKVTTEKLEEYKSNLYKTALENPTKTFYLTKVGCGIAGFEEDVMKKIFKGEKPMNIIMPPGWNVVRGYKAFNEGLVTKYGDGMKYEFGKDFYHDGEIKLCASGFHFSKSLGDVYQFYSFGSIVCEVESEGEVIDDEYKSVTNHLRLVRMLNPQEAKANKNDTSTGYLNTGDWNTGDLNTGDWNTGDLNTGNRNTGDLNTGDLNTGNRNTGDLNTGDWNTGDRNTGNWNTGDRNTGNWNTASFHVGAFNTINPKEVYVFNKKCSKEKWDNAYKPVFLYFNLTEWIDACDMTDKEKEQYPTYKTTGGYLKRLDYKKAFQESYSKASEEDKKALLKLPNFNKKVFFEISGIKI